MRTRLIIVAVLAALAGMSITALTATAERSPSTSTERPKASKPRAAAGTVAAVDGDSLTVKLTDGTSITAALTDRTRVLCGPGKRGHGRPMGRPHGMGPGAHDGQRGERRGADVDGHQERPAPGQRPHSRERGRPTQAACKAALVEGATVQFADVVLVDGSAQFRHVAVRAASSEATPADRR